MTILALIFMGIVTTIVCACEGDYGPAKTFGTIVIYAIVIGLFLAFLAATGWGGLILILLLSIFISMIMSSED